MSLHLIYYFFAIASIFFTVIAFSIRLILLCAADHSL